MRKLIWINPPFSRNVKTNVGQTFLPLIDKHFPALNKVHKVFNRNTIKESYSYMSSMKSAINQHNTRILSKKKQPSNAVERKWDCRNSSDCPLQGNCLASNVVYEAEISTGDNNRKTYQTLR